MESKLWLVTFRGDYAVEAHIACASTMQKAVELVSKRFSQVFDTMEIKALELSEGSSMMAASYIE